MRAEGGRNLVDAALAAGARCFIAQSLAWVYAPARRGTVRTPNRIRSICSPPAPLVAPSAVVVALEGLTLHSSPLRGIVLRYGMLYGPGTWSPTASGNVPVHIDAAARAALLALQSEHSGIYNIAEEKGLVSAQKARGELGWQPEYRWAG